MAELAKEAGITVRTLRFYRERKLIPPPRREGRIAWYDDTHLARLRTISALLERGHTLNGIAELAEAFDHGRNVGELLGLGEPTEETPVRLSPRNSPTSSPARPPRRTSPPPSTSATWAPTAANSSTSAAASSTPPPPWSARASPSRKSWQQPAAYATTPTPWPTSSSPWSSPKTAPRRTSNAYAHWRRAWWRRSCRWRWTDGSAVGRGLEQPPRIRRRTAWPGNQVSRWSAWR